MSSCNWFSDYNWKQRWELCPLTLLLWILWKEHTIPSCKWKSCKVTHEGYGAEKSIPTLWRFLISDFSCNINLVQTLYLFNSCLASLLLFVVLLVWNEFQISRLHLCFHSLCCMVLLYARVLYLRWKQERFTELACGIIPDHVLIYFVFNQVRPQNWFLQHRLAIILCMQELDTRTNK